WFTSDLRVHDNAALAESGRAGAVAGVFVLNPAILERHARAPRRIAFMYASLQALDAGLRALGSRLVVVEGDPVAELPGRAATGGDGGASHAGNHEPAARAREARVARALERAGVTVRAAEAALVQAPATITTAGGGAYQVYSAYARVWEGLDAPAAVPPPRQWGAAASLRGVGSGCPQGAAG